MATVQAQSALACVAEGADDLQAALARVLADDIGLILSRVLLVFRRHADVLGGADRRARHGGTPQLRSSGRCADRAKATFRDLG